MSDQFLQVQSMSKSFYFSFFSSQTHFEIYFVQRRKKNHKIKPRLVLSHTKYVNTFCIIILSNVIMYNTVIRSLIANKHNCRLNFFSLLERTFALSLPLLLSPSPHSFLLFLTHISLFPFSLKQCLSNKTPKTNQLGL